VRIIADNKIRTVNAPHRSSFMLGFDVSSVMELSSMSSFISSIETEKKKTKKLE
jgi:hypothetical protein